MLCSLENEDISSLRPKIYLYHLKNCREDQKRRAKHGRESNVMVTNPNKAKLTVAVLIEVYISLFTTEQIKSTVLFGCTSLHQPLQDLFELLNHVLKSQVRRICGAHISQIRASNIYRKNTLRDGLTYLIKSLIF